MGTAAEVELIELGGCSEVAIMSFEEWVAQFGGAVLTAEVEPKGLLAPIGVSPAELFDPIRRMKAHGAIGEEQLHGSGDLFFATG